MHHAYARRVLALLAVGLTFACHEAVHEPVALDADALVATAADWQPSDLTEGLILDPARRAAFDEKLEGAHAAMLELHTLHEHLLSLDEGARAEYHAEVQEVGARVHDSHDAMMAMLTEDERTTFVERAHELMQRHHENGEGLHGEASDLHERLRSLH